MMTAPSRILIVDDTVAALQAMAQLFRQAGYEVAEAETGREALRLVHSFRPQLMVLDVVLADQSGLDVLRAIRGDAALKQVSVVLLSAFQFSPEEQAEGLDVGAEDYIARPIANAELLARVRLHLRQRELMDQLRASEKRYRDVLLHQTDGVVVVDHEGGLVRFANSAAEKIFGRAAKDFLGGVLGFHVEGSASSVVTVPQGDGPAILVEARRAPTEWGGRPAWVFTLHDVTARSRADATLVESEARYRLLFKSNPLPLWVYDLETLRFLAVNDAALAKYGYTREEFHRMTIADIRPPEDVPALIDAVLRVTPGLNHSGVWRHRLKDGTLIRVEIFSHTIEFGGRRAELIQANDISERLRTEESLREIESRLRQDSEQLRLQQAALEAASDSISVMDRAGRLEWINPAFAARYGYTREECIGRTPGELLKSGLHDQAFYQTMWKTILAGQVWSSEIVNRCRDGRQVTEDIAITPILGVDGRVKHFIAIKRDITGRKQESEMLLEQATLLDKAQDAILVRDLGHRITFWNKSAERLYGWSAAEAVGRPVEELLYRDQTAFLAATATTLEQGEWNGEIDQFPRNGRKLTVAGRWTLVRDDSGRPKSIFAINTDVTEKKKLEAQYLRAQRLESIGTLAGGIAHDLNNVLAPILISIELFRLDERNSDRLGLLRNIEKSALHGAELVKQVLSFARGMEGNFVEMNLRHLARDLQQIVRDTFPKSIDFRLTFARDLWAVRADATQIHQVMMNLCVNARDAMPAGGRLTLALENIVIDDANLSMNPDAKIGRYVVIQVEDTGTGIAPEVRDRIFDPFFTTKEVGKGTGLGLATVLTIVKGHGGFIEVHSEAGKGSKFSVYLPSSAAVSADGAVVEQKRLPRGSGEMVLVVDDEENVRYAAGKTLDRFGYRVILANHGAEAVALYATHRADVSVVLMDMAMPIMDGPAAIIALQSMNPEIKIVGSSGHVSGADVVKAMGAGVRHFVPKPYTAEALLKVLAQVLGKPVSKPPVPGSGQ